jgi:3-methyladenine DNA glycosylase AlkC
MIMSKNEDITKLTLNEKCNQARDPNTPPKTLVQLATDEEWYVRYWVALNPNTPLKVLEHLAADENYWVREEVANNLNTPIKTLEQLASDEYISVRLEVARNPNTPHYIKKFITIQEQLRSLP